MHFIAALLLLGALAVPTFASSEAQADVRPEAMVTESADATPLVFHYPERMSPLIDNLKSESPQTVASLQRTLGLEEFPRVDVFILPEVDDYFELNGEPNRAPEWAIGLSLSNQRTVVVSTDAKVGGAPIDVPRTFVHELAHVTVDLARDGTPVPRWFHEGFALLHADEWTLDRSERLSRAASTESLLSLWELRESFPAHHNTASLAYAQSFHFVRYMRQEFGDDVWARVIDELNASESADEGTDRSLQTFDEAIESATGRPFSEIHDAWMSSISGKTSVWAIFREDFTLFFGATFVFLLAWAVKRVRSRRRLEAMERQEERAGRGGPNDEWDYDRSRYPLPGDPGET